MPGISSNLKIHPDKLFQLVLQRDIKLLNSQFLVMQLETLNAQSSIVILKKE